jgi:hypothetical protein
MALVASLSLALAGLVGLGLAPAASAALVCPDGYDLVAGVCVSPVGAIQVIDDPACDVGELVDDQCKIPDGTEEIPAIATPTCPQGGTYDEGLDKCVKDAEGIEIEYCDFGWVGPIDHMCYTNWGRDSKPASVRTMYRCPGMYWHLDGAMCTGKPGDPTFSCNPPDRGPFAKTATDAGIACEDEMICLRQLYRYEDPNYTWICPEGAFGPFEGAAPRSLDQSDLYCEFRTDPTDDTPIVPGPGPAAVDFCPNLDGFQWENYDCNTPQPVAAPEVVTPAEPAVVAPVTAAAPQAATVAAPAPAAVSAGVAGTTVADAATIPAAVPAGDGSQAPTVPLWALAMLVAGALGVVVTSAKLVGARR